MPRSKTPHPTQLHATLSVPTHAHRYGEKGGVSSDWPLHRRIISAGARLLARPLSPLSDPMSGFFGVRREAYEAAKPKINPIGYKIALETYVKGGIASNELQEVSFVVVCC